MSIKQSISSTQPPLATPAIRLCVSQCGGALLERLQLLRPVAGDTLQVSLETLQPDGTWRSSGPLLSAKCADDLQWYFSLPSPSPAPAGSPDPKPPDSCGPLVEQNIFEDSYCSGSTPEADRKISSGSSGTKSTCVLASCDDERSANGKTQEREHPPCGWDGESCSICGAGDRPTATRVCHFLLSISKALRYGSSQ